jgi:hypothetical protein
MDEGNFYMISTYPNLPKDDERRKAYFDGVSDGIKQGRSGNQKSAGPEGVERWISIH